MAYTSSVKFVYKAISLTELILTAVDIACANTLWQIISGRIKFSIGYYYVCEEYLVSPFGSE